jgi:hypothetical protein
MNRRNIFGIIMALLALTPYWLSANNVRGGGKVVIDEPVERNLYIGGGEVQVNAPIGGDLVAAAGKLNVMAQVGGDALLAGGEVNLEEVVNGDLRVVGGKVQVRRDVMGDLLSAGGEITVASGVSIGGDLIIAGGKVTLLGTVKGKIYLTGGEATLRGVVEGGLEARGGKLNIDAEVRGASSLSAQEIALGPNARFLADVEYWTKSSKISFDPHLEQGAKAIYSEKLKSNLTGPSFKPFRAASKWFSLYRFLAGVVLIILVTNFSHRFFYRRAGKMTENVAGNLGYGLLYLFGLPILIILCLITVIGIPVGLILFAGYGVSLILAGALVAVALTYEYGKLKGKDWNIGTITLVAIAVSLGLRLLNFVPVVGGLLLFVLTAVTFGYLYRNFWANPPQPSPAATEDSDIV